jgi:hypothetical protein
VTNGWLPAAGAVTLGVLVGLGILFAPLPNSAARWGAVSLEFAGSATRAASVIESWSPADRQRAAAGFGLSFLFLLALPAALALSCRRSAAELSVHWPAAARLLTQIAAAQPLMPLAGIVENAMVLYALLAAPVDPLMAAIAALASVKFAVTIAGVAGAAGGWLLRTIASR